MRRFRLFFALLSTFLCSLHSTIALAIAQPPPGPRALASDDFSYSSRDKQLHLAVSGVSGLALNQLCRTSLKSWSLPSCILAGSATVLAIGMIKEGLDREFSLGDMTANGIGVAMGALVTIAIDF